MSIIIKLNKVSENTPVTNTETYLGKVSNCLLCINELGAYEICRYYKYSNNHIFLDKKGVHVDVVYWGYIKIKEVCNDKK